MLSLTRSDRLCEECYRDAVKDKATGPFYGSLRERCSTMWQQLSTPRPADTIHNEVQDSQIWLAGILLSAKEARFQ